jgi:hypothetical protein
MVGAWTGDAIRRSCHASPSSPLDVTSALCALPCRIAGQAGSGGHPRESITSPRDWPLLAPHARHFVRYQNSEYEVKSRSPAWLERPHESSRAPGIGGIGTSLISGKSSLIRNEESLMSQKNSLFTNVGNLLLSH